MQTNRRERLTRQDGLVPSAEPTAHGRANDMQDAPQVLLPSVGQRRWGAYTPVREVYNMSVPVVDQNHNPLMPTTASRARRWIKLGEATPLFNRGIFYVRLNRDPSTDKKQEIAVGIDPGSKKEGITVKSEAHTYLNIQADAVTWVKDAMEVRRNMRRSRRFRKTPCRAGRYNRARGCLAPSTKARWQWKIRVIKHLSSIFPITIFVVEDIKTKTRGKPNWDVLFSPLEVGKLWFYNQLGLLAKVELKRGWETAQLRVSMGLKKTSRKLAEVFEAHCVDSWVLANSIVGGHTKPDNTRMLCIEPIRLHRRQLYLLQPAKTGFRKSYGGTRSCGFKRGSLVKHSKYGVTYVGGTMNGRVSLHSVITGKRLCQNAKPSDISLKTYNTWRVHSPVAPKLRNS